MNSSNAGMKWLVRVSSFGITSFGRGLGKLFPAKTL